MHPVFHVFGLKIPAYTLFTIIGALAATVLAVPALKRKSIRPVQSVGLLVAMCAAFLIGARLWNVWANPGNYLGSLKWYSLQLTGLSLFGGLLGAGLVFIVALLLLKKPVLGGLDAMTLPAGVAFCFARVGCFLNGCCSGKATKCPLGVEFPSREAAHNLLDQYLPFVKSVRTVHPTQLYELFGAAVGLPLVLLFVRKLKLWEGATFFLYAAWFSLVRLLVLPLRALSYPDLVKKVIYPALYAGIILVGVGATVVREKLKKHN